MEGHARRSGGEGRMKSSVTSALGVEAWLWRLDGGEAGDSDIVDSNPLGNGIGVVLVGCMDGDTAPMSLSCLSIHRALVVLLHCSSTQGIQRKTREGKDRNNE